MAVQPGYWGIDIGQCALKAVRVQIIDNKVTATAFDYVEHPKILSQPDADPEQLTRDALEKFLSRNTIKGDHIAIGVPGQSGLARFVKLPPVEEKKVDDIVQFEAKQQIPFPLDEVVWDYQRVSDGVVEGGFAMDTEIGLFAMKRDLIARYMNHFQSVKVEVHVIQMSPLALCNYVTYDILNKGGPGVVDAPAAPTGPGKRRCIVVLDVGTDGSNLIITDGGKIIWQRPIPIGGGHFTRALSKELKLTFAKAEHVKRNAAKSTELAGILRALKPVLTDFVGEVQRSLGYFTNTHRDAQVDYLIGLGSAFKLPGLQKYLSDKLQLKVDKPKTFHRLAGEAVTSAPVFIDNLLTFPVAYGLALQAAGAARLKTNLLPPEITRDRTIRAKKPWAVAAAALLMVGTGVLAYGYSVPLAAVSNPKIIESIKTADGANQAARNLDKEIAGKKVEVETNIKKIQAIVAGKEERLNWLRLSDYINAAMPIPGENGNMKDGAQLALWNNQEGGIAATNRYFERIREGVDPKTAVGDKKLQQHLAAVDIEAVYGRYAPDLSDFFKRAKNYCVKNVGTDVVFQGMDGFEREPMMRESPVFPTGPGWIIEIRGTTCYKQEKGTIKGTEFLKMTLLANLQAAAKGPLPPELSKRISHIFLYNAWEDEAPRQDAYYYIQDSLLDELMGGAGDTGGGGEGTGAIRPPAGGTWRPIYQGTGGSAAQPKSGSRTYERTSITPPTPMKKDGPKDPKDPMTAPTATNPRYEFVILFLWREHVPSDDYLKTAQTAPASP